MTWPFSEEHEELRGSLRRAFDPSWMAPASQDGAQPLERLQASGLIDDVSGDRLATLVVAEELGGNGALELGWSFASLSSGESRDLLCAAVVAAAAAHAFDLTKLYAAERTTFGRPISKHQVVRHMLADMAAETHAARALVHEAAALQKEDVTRTSLGAALAAAWRVVDHGVQIFGGAGYSRGSPIEALWRQVAAVRADTREQTGPRPAFRSSIFTPQHDHLRAEVRDFLRETVVPHVDEWEAREAFPRELFRAASQAGVFGWKYPSSVGGSGVDPVADAVVTEELTGCGSGGVAASFGAHKDLACLYLWGSGTAEQHDRWLVPALAGEAIGALAVTEPDAGSDVAAIKTRARRDGSDWILDGAKVFITNGAWADFVVVAAKTDPDAGHGGITLFVVSSDSPGYSARRMPMLGWRPSQTGDLAFDGVRLGDEHRLGDVGDGFYAICATSPGSDA